MKYTLIENGTDSFKSAFENIEKFGGITQGGRHRLKDAVIFLNHGVEILLKYILQEHHPSFIFNKIDSYLDAKKNLKKISLDTRKNPENKKVARTVFDVKNLQTVGIAEALRRVEYLCDIEIPLEFKNSISAINEIRNQIMHYEVDIDDSEKEKLITRLKYCYQESVDFFKVHIDNLEHEIVMSRFEFTHEEYEEEREAIWEEVMEYERIRREELYRNLSEDDLYDLMLYESRIY
ncbi:hypothetical protein H7992_07250 [Sporosarcina sp. resist]|uniref:hypothetical protein n=1 Tax=Sporosarcina sp. resist TaxID=2762563 RepID=UPI00164D3D02|nr:hypothetical protein [Sporosarcina sp. resist]QNK89454.1 hypothetical protein H7992_07250 [Sporosarcina sp. resist]